MQFVDKPQDIWPFIHGIGYDKPADAETRLAVALLWKQRESNTWNNWMTKCMQQAFATIELTLDHGLSSYCMSQVDLYFAAGQEQSAGALWNASDFTLLEIQ
eukprot:scaffold330091_cov48-Prasinocladus_malaysianus.AAC.1